jgi:putative membrane protein
MIVSTVLAWVGPRGLVVGFLLPVAIVALVAYGVFELLRASSTEGAMPVAASPGGPSTGPSSTALGILEERFARGEIDAEEYVQRRTLLSPGAPPAPAEPAPSADTAAHVASAAPVEPDPTTAVVADEATSEQPATAVEPGDAPPEDRSPS